MTKELTRAGNPVHLRSAMALVLVFAAIACPAERRGLSREALLSSLQAPPEQPLPTIDELLALRVPTPPAGPVMPLLGSRHLLAVANGDVGKIDDAALACLVADVRRDYRSLEESCLRVLDVQPGDPRAPVAVAILHRATNAIPSLRTALLARAGAPVELCRTQRARTGVSCADLAQVLSEAQQSAARQLGRLVDVAAAAGRSGRLRHAQVDGPWLNVDDALLGGPPPAKHPRFVTLSREERNADDVGVLRPARRGLSGVWRAQFSAEGGGPVTLYLKGTGPMRLRIDEQEMFVRAPGAAPGTETERLPLELASGRHVIEVLSFDGGGGFSAALLDDDGRPAFVPAEATQTTASTTASTSSTATATTAATSSARVRRGAGSLEALLLPANLQGNDLDALATLLFRHQLARAGFGLSADDEMTMAATLMGKFGWSPVALASALATIEDDDTLPERLATALARPLWERVEQFWPDHPVALLARARALRDERPDEAVAAFRAVTKARPDYPFGHRDLIGAALDVGLVDEARRAARTLLSLGVSRENIDAAVPALREGGASLEAAVALDRRAGLDPLQDAWRRALSQGATADGVELLQRAVAFEPDGVLEPLLDLEEVSAPRAAKARLEEAVRRFPHDVGLKVRLARLVAAFDGVQPALAILREHPFDQRALFLAVELGEVPPWQERLSWGDEVIQQRRALVAEPFAGFGSVLLLDDVERHFADDGSALVVRHFVAELRSKEALDGYGELRVEDDERLLRLRVVKPDGSVVEPERHAQVADISLTGLSPYDVVEYLSVTFDGSGRDGTFWEMRGLDGPAPALRRSYAVTWSEKLEAQMGPVTLRADNGLARPPVETSGGRRRATFLVENVPALLAEPSSVAAEESERLAGVSFHLDQDFWRRSRGRGLASLSRQDPWLAVCAQRIAGAGDTDARLARVFQFVADRIVPADAPGDATTVLATGRGRRLPLFVALARAAGLTPEPIALHPTLAVPTTIPTASLFSTVAVRVRTPTGPHVILLQDQLALIDDLPPIFRQAAVLPLFGPGETAPLPDAVIDDEPVRVQVDLGLEGESLTGLIVVRMPAYLSELLRPSLRQATDEQLVQMLEAALAASLPGVQISAVRLPNLQQAATSLVIGADVRVPLKASEGVVRYEHLFAGGAAAAFGVGQPLGALNRVADRRRALRVNPESELLELQLRLPRNASFVETPRPVSAQAGPIRLVQRAEVQEGTLIWRRELIRDAARVGPGAWPGMRAQLGTLLSRADGRIAFVLPRPSHGPAPGPAPTNDVR